MLSSLAATPSLSSAKAVQPPQSVEHEVVQRMAMLILATVRGGEATPTTGEACRDD